MLFYHLYSCCQISMGFGPFFFFTLSFGFFYFLVTLCLQFNIYGNPLRLSWHTYGKPHTRRALPFCDLPQCCAIFHDVSRQHKFKPYTPLPNKPYQRFQALGQGPALVHHSHLCSVLRLEPTACPAGMIDNNGTDQSCTHADG